MKNFPSYLFEEYRDRKISRGCFLLYLSEWQRRIGIDFSCRGKNRDGFFVLTYRGEEGIIRRTKNATFIKWQEINCENSFTFRRLVDFVKNREDCRKAER